MTSDKTPSEAATNYATKGAKSLFHTRVSAYLAGDTNGYSRGKADERERIFNDIMATRIDGPNGFARLKQIIFGGGDVD